MRLKQLQKAITLKPDHKVHNNLGIVMQELGKLDEAEASYKKAITLKLTLYKLLEIDGYFYLTKKDRRSIIRC